MAKITTTFGFKDNISQNLSLLNNTLTQLNQTMRSMKGGAGEASDGLDRLGGKAQGVSAKLVNFNMITGAFRAVKGAVDSVTASMGEMSAAYNFQYEQETKLQTVMKNHMKATDDQIKEVKEFAAAQQQRGIYGDEMILQGAQELATYIEDVDTLKGLMPVLNSMLAQGVGMGASSRDMQSYATMLGKVMQGQVGGMSKRGYKFTEAEEEILKTGTELQKLQVLQNNVLGNFGDMNAALAATPQGRIIQLTNNMSDLKEQVGQALIPYQQLFSISTMNWKIKWYETLIKALDKISKYIKEITIAIMSLGAVVAAIAVKMAISWAIANAPLIAMVAAITAVVAAISALLIYSEKTFPFIGGLIGGVAGIAKEVAAQIKYYFGAAIEGIVNGFLKMKDRVTDFFLGMLEIIVSGISKIATVIDAVFKTNVSESISGFQTSLKALREQSPEEFTLGWKDNRKGFENAYKEGKLSGSQTGANLSDKLQGWLDDKLSGLQNATNLSGAGTGSEFLTDSSGALVTADKNVLELSDEYKELLSEQARRKFSLNYSQITPEVTVGDININNDMDADNLIEKLVSGVKEATNARLWGT